MQEQNTPSGVNISLITGRIEELRRFLRLDKKPFCDRIGANYKLFTQITGPRGTKPNAELLAAIVANTEVNPTWLLTGSGPMLQSAEPAPAAMETAGEGLRAEAAKWEQIAGEKDKRIEELLAALADARKDKDRAWQVADKSMILSVNLTGRESELLQVYRDLEEVSQRHILDSSRELRARQKKRGKPDKAGHVESPTGQPKKRPDESI